MHTNWGMSILFSRFYWKWLGKTSKKNPFCINEQKKISENKLKTQKKNEYKEKTVKGLLIRYNLWEKVETEAKFTCDHCKRGFKSMPALRHHDTSVHRQEQNPDAKPNSKKRKILI